MRLSSLLGLVAASAVEASICRPSKPAASASSSSSAPAPSNLPCYANILANQQTGVSPPHAWQYAPGTGVTVSYPATCMNNAYNNFPDGSCVNFLLADAPQSAVTAVTITRTIPTVVGRTYFFGFSYVIGSDEAAANTGNINNIACQADNTAHSNGWSPFYMGYDEDKYWDLNIEVVASSTATTFTCVLTVDTAIDMTVSRFFLEGDCSD